MSFGFSCGDFLGASVVAWNIWQACKGSESALANIASEVLSLHIVLKEIGGLDYDDVGMGKREEDVKHLLGSCKSVLEELEALLKKYERMGQSLSRKFEVLRFTTEDVDGLRSRMVAQVNLLNAFNTSCQMSSHQRLEKKLDRFMAEVRAGLREGSIVSALSTAAEDEEDAWRLLCHELENVGITAEVFQIHIEFIKDWFDGVLSEGLLDDSEVAEPVAPKVNYSGGDWGDDDDFYDDPSPPHPFSSSSSGPRKPAVGVGGRPGLVKAVTMQLPVPLSKTLPAVPKSEKPPPVSGKGKGVPTPISALPVPPIASLPPAAANPEQELIRQSTSETSDTEPAAIVENAAIGLNHTTPRQNDSPSPRSMTHGKAPPKSHDVCKTLEAPSSARDNTDRCESNNHDRISFTRKDIRDFLYHFRHFYSVQKKHKGLYILALLGLPLGYRASVTIIDECLVIGNLDKLVSTLNDLIMDSSVSMPFLDAILGRGLIPRHELVRHRTRMRLNRHSKIIHTASLLEIHLDRTFRSIRDRNPLLEYPYQRFNIAATKVLLRDVTNFENLEFIVNVPGLAGLTPMHLAASYEEFSDLLEVLVMSKMDVNIAANTDERDPRQAIRPLHCAASTSARLVNILLDNGAQESINTVGSSTNETPLHSAIHLRGKVFFVWQFSIPFDFPKDTYLSGHISRLSIADLYDQISIIKALIHSGADINRKDIHGHTPLHLAAMCWNSRVVELLLENGAMVHSRDKRGMRAVNLVNKRNWLVIYHDSEIIQESLAFPEDKYRSEHLEERDRVLAMLQTAETLSQSRRR